MSKRLQKIRGKWDDTRLLGLKGVSKDIAPDVIFNAVVSADPTPNHKYVDWSLNAWARGTFQWEDIRLGKEARVADQLLRFETNKHRIPDPAMRSLLKYKGPGELDAAMDAAGVQREISFFDMSSNQQKKAMMIKARLESQHVKTESGLQFDIPLSEFASNILGRNTRWCTAASKDNQFSEYAETGPLIIVTLPSGKRFQTHCNLMEFMDLSEIRNSIEDVEEEGEEVDAEVILASIMDSREFTILNEDDSKLDSKDLEELYPFRKEVFEFIGKAYTDIAEYYIESYSDEQHHKEFIQAYKDIVSSVFETQLFDDYKEVKKRDDIIERRQLPDTPKEPEEVVLNEENALDVLTGVIDAWSNINEGGVEPPQARSFLTNFLSKKYNIDNTVSLETKKQILKYLDNTNKDIPFTLVDAILGKSFFDNIDIHGIKELKAFIESDIKNEQLKDTMVSCFRQIVKDIEIFKAYYDFDNISNAERLRLLGSLWNNKELHSNGNGDFCRDIKKLFMETVLQNGGYNWTQLSQNEKDYLGFKEMKRAKVPFQNHNILNKVTIALAFDRSSAYSDEALNAVLMKNKYSSDIVKEFPEDIQKALFIMGKSHDNSFVKGLFMDGEYKEPSDAVLENRLSGERSLSSKLSPYLGLLSLESMEVLAKGNVTPEICDEAMVKLERIIHFYRDDPIIQETIERIRHNEDDVAMPFHAMMCANKIMDDLSAKAREIAYIHQTVKEEKEILLRAQNKQVPQLSH